MSADSSVRFFDAQFERQVREGDFALNPFETAALPYLENGPVSTSTDWERLVGAFGGNFGLFALFVN